MQPMTCTHIHTLPTGALDSTQSANIDAKFQHNNVFNTIAIYLL